ncbi:aldehyde ferredoxin oxidoreductase N-terminal domain-containing protein [Chloroflexota bacterium]
MSGSGYAGEILKVDLSRGSTSRLQTDDYTDRFVGGRGIAARIYWDAVSPETAAYDPENSLIFANGPLAGFSRLAGSRWQVCGKSPSRRRDFFSYANLGGSWGAWLKFAGYDGLAVKGKSDKPVFLFIHDGKVETRDASFLWGKSAIEAREILKAELGKEVRVVSTGPAGENMVSFATLLADEDSSGSGGLGGVMGSKGLKAIAVAGNKRPTAANPGRLNELAEHISRLRKGTWDVYTPMIKGRTRRHNCYGCTVGCSREDYRSDDGERVKFFCQSADFYGRVARKYYGDFNEAAVYATRLCHGYGLDTFVIEPMILWLSRCYEEGILKEEETGIPLSKVGSSEFIEALVKKISLREGFGDVLAHGTLKAAEMVGKGASELIGDSIATEANDLTNYDPRIFIATGLLHATEPRKPIQQLHEVAAVVLQWLERLRKTEHSFLAPEDVAVIGRKFWGSSAAADFSTYEGKALAAKMIQDRTYAKESLILCDYLWPAIWVRYSEEHTGDPTLESQVYSAVTGRETDEEGLNKLGEGIFNLQRAILLREGWGGREGDRILDVFYETPIQTMRFNRECLVPGSRGESVSRKGAVVEREEFEKMKDEYYDLRGWDVASGLPAGTRLKELGLGDIARDLEKSGLVK